MNLKLEQLSQEKYEAQLKLKNTIEELIKCQQLNKELKSQLDELHNNFNNQNDQVETLKSDIQLEKQRNSALLTQNQDFAQYNNNHLTIHNSNELQNNLDIKVFKIYILY